MCNFDVAEIAWGDDVETGTVESSITVPNPAHDLILMQSQTTGAGQQATAREAYMRQWSIPDLSIPDSVKRLFKMPLTVLRFEMDLEVTFPDATGPDSAEDFNLDQSYTVSGPIAYNRPVTGGIYPSLGSVKSK